MSSAGSFGQPEPASEARHAFITWASCHVRRTVSPIRPMPCESLLMIEIAPRSCSGPSAAMVAGWIRSRAAARSSASAGLPSWTMRIMSTCSAAVARAYGSPGVVEEQITFGSRTMPIRSGMWPPPTPST